MFRSTSRVVVVAVVVFAFAAGSIPAHAALQGGGKTTAKMESGWFESVIAWMSEAIFGDPLKSTTTSISIKQIHPDNGSCIDPWGRCQ